MTAQSADRTESVLTFLLWYVVWTSLDSLLVLLPHTTVVGLCVSLVIVLWIRRRRIPVPTHAPTKDIQNLYEHSLNTSDQRVILGSEPKQTPVENSV